MSPSAADVSTPEPGAGLAGVLLAAGRASRYGADKLLVPLPDGRPLGLAAAAALTAAVGRMLVVVRAGDDGVAGMFRAAGHALVICPDAAHGMAHSLACGIAASGDAAGWVVALADMPAIRPQTYAALLATFRRSGGIVLPTCAGRRGHPVLFAREFGPALRELTGDRGARDVLAAQAGAVHELVTDDPGVLLDVDTPADRARLP